ncbi:hypothetical protein ACEPAI_7440 [Sanghuangporus weigelae]
MDLEDSQPTHRRPFLTLRKESSADDDVTLYKERTNSLVPLARSPFKPLPEPEPEPAQEIKYRPDEYVVFVTELPWSDLLLEIAMTTAFASLTDGTPILEASSIASYLSFFALVWWVWASQVAYNVRFRQSDWLHRIFAFFQLVVFCALAAFTNNFDVTNGIVDDSNEAKKLADIQMADFYSAQDVAAANFRNNRLPTLNARGISLTMAFSRLLLLVQYLLAFFHALRHTRESAGEESRVVRRSAFFVHIGALVFSSLCYFIAYGVIGRSPDEDDQIAKLALWYFPLLVEVASHFVAATLPGRVRYPARKIYERSSTVFIIILGGGLDKITNGFQYIAGNVSLGLESLGLILCGVVIFALLFTLYFSSSEGDTLGSRRALALFFFQFFYLSALIVTLQGIAAMLEVGNIGSALETPFQFIRDTQSVLESKGFGVYLNETDYGHDITRKLNKTGIALNTLLDIINWGVDDAWNQTDYNLTFNYLLQTDLAVIATILSASLLQILSILMIDTAFKIQNFNALPESGSLLGANMSLFLDSNSSDYTVVNNATFNDLSGQVITTNATPALWFYAAGGSVLVTLALMNLINRWPRDKYEWGQTISRLVVGSLVICFTAIDANASNDVLGENLEHEGSRIWYLATHSLVLPPYAVALITEQLIELVLLHLAGRSYNGNFSFSIFWRKIPRVVPYVPTGTNDQSYSSDAPNSSKKMYDEPFDHHDLVYDPYEKTTEYSGMPQPPITSVASPPAGAPTFESRNEHRSQSKENVSGKMRRIYRKMSSQSSIQPLISR